MLKNLFRSTGVVLYSNIFRRLKIPATSQKKGLVIKNIILAYVVVSLLSSCVTSCVTSV